MIEKHWPEQDFQVHGGPEISVPKGKKWALDAPVGTIMNSSYILKFFVT